MMIIAYTKATNKHRNEKKFFYVECWELNIWNKERKRYLLPAFRVCNVMFWACGWHDYHHYYCFLLSFIIINIGMDRLIEHTVLFGKKVSWAIFFSFLQNKFVCLITMLLLWWWWVILMGWNHHHHCRMCVFVWSFFCIFCPL